MCSCRVLLLLVLAPGSAVVSAMATAPRTRENFDTDWRFHLGEVATTPAADCTEGKFPEPLNGVQCLGLQSHEASSAVKCRQAACSLGATVWQWAARMGCWIGHNCDNQGPSGAGWQGAGRPNNTIHCQPGSPCEPGYNDSAWRTVTVPHDFVIEGAVSRSLSPSYGALPTNTSWYRKSFTLPPRAAPPTGLVWLTFDGVFRAADVYINGAWVRHHTEGYTSFVAFIHNATAPLYYGPGTENVIAVHLDATQSELWAYEGGGIYRHVWLETAGKVSVMPWGFAFPTHVTGAITGQNASAPQTADGAVAMPRLDVANAGETAALLTVTFTLSSPDGVVALNHTCGPFTVPPKGFRRVTPGSGATHGPALPFGSSLMPLQLWNIADSPPLYNAVAEVREANSDIVWDRVEATVGIRDALFDPRRGFVLNGVKVMIKGVSNHLGFGAVGLGVPDRIMEFQVATLKAMGANAWRTAHNPVAPELLAFADRYGMLVWEENRFITHGVQPLKSSDDHEEDAVMMGNFSDPSTAAATVGARDIREPRPSRGQPGGAPVMYVNPTGKVADPALLLDAQDMVLRDRNHPSIVIWSLCNELGCVANDPNGSDIAAQFKQSMQAADRSRPITGNTVQWPFFKGEGGDCGKDDASCVQITDRFSDMMDVQSFSYNYQSYTDFHSLTPWKPVGGGESASCVTDRGVFQDDKAAGHLAPTNPKRSHLGDLFACIQASWAPVANNPFVFGNYVWTGFDYRGEPNPTGWPAVSSHFGIFDIGGVPKVGAGYYKAWWREGLGARDVWVSPDDWTSPVPVGHPVPVHVTTAAHSASVFVNGVMQHPGPVVVPRYGFANWSVPFTRGNLTAVAYNADGGVAAMRTIMSAGKPARLLVTVVAPYLHGRNGTEIAADGRDAALISVELVDTQGVLVPNADVAVTVSVEGPAVVLGTTNGDPACHSRATSPECPTFHGVMRAVIRSAKSGVGGVITVHATAAGVTAGKVMLRAVIP